MKYKPHDYQAYATNFILEHPISAVFLDMGLGKSVITLSAIFDLCLDYFSVRKVLVIAPLRVARDTWPAEIQKWDHLNGLSYSVAVGTELERKVALQQRVFLYIINRENVQWLVEESGLPFDYDKEAKKAIFDADTLTTDLADLLIERVLVYPDKVQ